MPIQSGDVKMLRSAVMADVPEGGGAPTASVIEDGVSNAIFPDISELDRAGGRVNLRKAFVSIQTDNTDLYFGGNVIVAAPPQDPRVSVTLFSTNNTFDTRTQAQNRIEAYLNKGPEWVGYLYENHIQGQRVIQLFQRLNSELPSAGQTLVLVHAEGTVNEIEQYVRVTSVSVVERTFTFFSGATPTDYKAWIVTCDISDALRFNFAGTSANREFTSSGAATRVRDTLVADAGTYVGVTQLTQTAGLGDFAVRGQSIFTQLVPSAQTETPISDLRTNGLSAALVSTGAPVTVNLALAFTTSQNLHVGGPIFPGSLSLVRSDVTLTDLGGLLVNAGAQVGLVDYENGILSLISNVFGTGGGSHAVTFMPATVPELISDQRAIRVTITSQSLSYVFTLDDIPLRRTLQVSYLAQGRWYVLREDGSGTIRGLDAAFGIGTLNFTTGSVVLTLGALPDVGSVILIQSYSEASTVQPSNTTLANGGRFYIPINSNGQISEERGSKPMRIGSLRIGWNDGSARLATDDGAGNLTGAATGTVDYSAGVVRISPNTLPAPGTVFLVDLDTSTPNTSAPVPVSGASLGATNIAPGTVSFNVKLTFSFSSSVFGSAVSFASREVNNTPVSDNGAGTLRLRDPGNGAWVSCGTVNYAAGTFTLNTLPAVGVSDAAGPLIVYPTTLNGQPSSFTRPWNNPFGPRARSVLVEAMSGASVVFHSV